MLTPEQMQQFRSITSSALASSKKVSTQAPAPTTSTMSTGNDQNWSDLPGNIAPSAWSLVSNIGSAIIHPLDTLSSLKKVGEGAFATYLPGGVVDKNQANVEESKQAFSNVKDYFVSRYGGMENIKKTIINDPVGFAADLSTILDAGAGLAGGVSKASEVAGATRVAETAAKTSEALSSASKITNPITLGTKAITKPLGAVTSRVVKPLSESIDTAAVNAASRIGTELPASVASNSPVVRGVEAIVSKGFFGGRLYPKVQAVAEALVGTARKVIADTGASADLSSTGRAISEGFNAFKQNFIDLKNEIYNSIELPKAPEAPIKTPGYAPSASYTPKPAAGVGFVEAPKSSTFARQILGSKEGAAAVLGSSKDAQAFATIAKNLSEGGISFDQMRSAIQELNQKIGFSNDPIIVGNKAQWAKLAATMEDEFIASLQKVNPAAAEKLTQANAYFSDVVTQLGTTWAKNIQKFADQPDKILGAILSPSTSVEDIPRILEVAGAEAKPAIQASMLDTLFNSARNADGMFKPGGVASAIKSYGEGKLAAILSPEQLQVVKDIDTLSRSLGKAASITEGSQTAFLNKLMSYGAGLGFNWPLTLKVFVGDALLGSFISSKAGQNFLLNGFRSSSITDLLRGTAQNAVRASEAGKVSGETK